MATSPQPTSEATTVVQTAVESAWNDGELDALDELYADSVTTNRLATPRGVSHDGSYSEYVRSIQTAYSDLTVSIDDLLSVDDIVVASLSGTGQRSDGESASLSGTQVFRFEDGTIVERWGSILERSELDQFDRELRGVIIEYGDEGYEDARKVWNGMIDKYPAMIVQCTGVVDVVDAVNFARERGMLVSVKGGGHNVSGKAVCNGGMKIDLSPMNGVVIDPDEQVARVQPGCDWGIVDREAQHFGLVNPAGVVSTTGVAGLTLGGGYGWTSRKFGLACDHLVEAQVVTADGNVVRATEDQNSDLLWGLRGGGGNFGIVTTFVFDLAEMEPNVLAGALFYALDDAEDCLKYYREWNEDAPREATVFPIFRTAPEIGFIPEEHQGEPIFGFGLCYTGDPEEGREVMEPILDYGEPIADLVRVRDFPDWQSWSDVNWPKGRRYYWKSNYIDELSDGAIETLVSYSEGITAPETEVLVAQLGGAISDVDNSETAYPHRDAPYLVAIDSNWEDPEEDEHHISWTREFYDALEPYYTDGVYVNYLGNEGQDRVEAAYGENYDRLVELKKKYDPNNLFSMTQNVKPRD